ncbi:MAG TPA: hypothetical protein VJC15_03555 [Candidatus Paceibacterota bacterium]
MVTSTISEEQEKIDSYLISADITFIAGFIVFFSLSRPVASLVAVFSLSAIFFFLSSFLFSLWHRYRHAKRQHLYDVNVAEVNRIHTKEMEQLKDLFYKIGKLRGATEALSEKLGEILKASNQQMREVRTEFKLEDADFLDEIIAELWTRRLKEVGLKSFSRPLDEKYAISKYVLDYIVSRGRYTVFIVGIICFFVALVFHLSVFIV